MKIASWNVNSLNVRLPHLTQWLAAAQPDIVALQETKLEDAKFPAEAINALGYRVVFSGQKTYNGVAILARGELSDVVTDIPGLDDPQRRILAATVGATPAGTTTGGNPGVPGPEQAIRIVNLYVVNGQEVGSEKYTGTAIGNSDFLAISYTSGNNQTGLALYGADGGNWKGVWTYAGGTTMGAELWKRE